MPDMVLRDDFEHRNELLPTDLDPPWEEHLHWYRSDKTTERPGVFNLTVSLEFTDATGVRWKLDPRLGPIEIPS
jgi:hypothetical protein